MSSSRTFTLSDLPRVVADLRAAHPEARVFALTGELGAGKTTLVTEFCRQLGVTDPISSPTFSIANEYRGEGLTVFHLDAYRLKDLDEALAIGVEDYFATGDYCFVEWPAVIEPILPSGVVHIRLAHPAAGPAQHRLLTVTPA